MNTRRVIEVFNRDMAAACVTGNPKYVETIIEHAIEFYNFEKSLPWGHQMKMFSDAEYELLIELYEAEYLKRQRCRSNV